MEIKLALNKDQALVLFEFLCRTSETENLNDVLFEDKAEQLVLWNLEGQLETLLVEPFYPDYLDIIKAARDTVRNSF